MTTITINVTQEDIDTGHAGDCNLCPIAVAASRAFPDKCPTVSCVNIYLDSAPGIQDGPGYRLPPEAEKFIADFDTRRAVKPFSFTVVV